MEVKNLVGLSRSQICVDHENWYDWPQVCCHFGPYKNDAFCHDDEEGWWHHAERFGGASCKDEDASCRVGYDSLCRGGWLTDWMRHHANLDNSLLRRVGYIIPLMYTNSLIMESMVAPHGWLIILMQRPPQLSQPSWAFWPAFSFWPPLTSAAWRPQDRPPFWHRHRGSPHPNTFKIKKNL